MRIKNTLTVSFYTERELTEEEADALQLQVTAQVEEPVNLYGEDVDYTTELFGSEMEMEEEK